MKLLSVIIPVYNVENYLERCILSVIYQTYTNIEIILVDDGSTDSSGQLCDKFALKYNNIKVIHKKNGGLSDARNAGIAIAKGYYLAFLDSDDFIHPQMYKILISQLELNNADLAECEYIKIYSQAPKLEKIEAAPVILMNREEAILSGYDWKFFTAVVWNKVYKRELISAYSFPVGRFHEDEFYIHNVLYNANKLLHVSAKMHYYQQRNGSIMSSELDIRHADALDAFKIRIEFFKDKNEILYQRGCIALVDHVLTKMQYLCANSNLPPKTALSLYNAYGLKFQALNKEIIDVYTTHWHNSPKRIAAINLLYKNPSKFHFFYKLYKFLFK